MKAKLSLFLCLLVSIILFLSCGDKETIDIYGSIDGKVTDAATGKPLNAAIVTLVPGASTYQTAEDGAFSFVELDEGQYTVSVQKDGYQPNRKNITVNSGEKTDIVVSLTIIPQ